MKVEKRPLACTTYKTAQTNEHSPPELSCFSLTEKVNHSLCVTSVLT